MTLFSHCSLSSPFFHPLFNVLSLVVELDVKTEALQLSVPKTRALESHRRMQWLVNKIGFVSVNNLGAVPISGPFGMGAAPPPQQDRQSRTFGSGMSGSRASNIHGVSDGATSGSGAAAAPAGAGSDSNAVCKLA
jgi:hypothetical protein